MDNKRIVVKVGTSTLTYENGRTNLQRLEMLARVLSDIRSRGHEVILVSSGAIAMGAEKLKMKERPTELRYKQAAAAVGQCSAMFYYDKFFHEYDQEVAQILLNAEDIDNEEKKANLTGTFLTLLEMGVIPVVTENDSIGHTEIESADRLFGDNDMLSAIVAGLCDAQLLVIFSDIDGFYDKDPRKNEDAQLISRIGRIDEETFALAGGAGSRRGTGGMVTKLRAASYGMARGIDTVVTNGVHPESLYDILGGHIVGTLFSAPDKSL